MFQDFLDSYLQLFVNSSHTVKFLGVGISLIFIIILGLFCFVVVRLITDTIITRHLKESSSLSLYFIAKSHLLHLLPHFAFAIVIYFGSDLLVLHDYLISNYLASLTNKIAVFYLSVVLILIVNGLINTFNKYYDTKFTFAKQFPIYSYLGVIKFIVWIVGFLLLIAYYLKVSPWALLTGIGALSAVLLLVFKDTLLGIVSSLQVTVTNMFQIGDYISIEKYNLEGTILNIAISSVKIKNLDNTITTIPTYMLISEIVKNWKYLPDSQTRRMKKKLIIDVHSIKNCNEALLAKLKPYYSVDEITIIQSDKSQYEKPQTNLTIFRAYCEQYLRQHVQIDESNTLVVFLKDITSTGVELSINAYIRVVDYVLFEHIQAEICEKLICDLNIFELKVFQLS